MAPGISRRSFLIASAAGGAALVASPHAMKSGHASSPPVSGESKVTPTLCDACGNWCAIKVYTKGDKVWKAEGIPIAGKNLGRICAKGHGMLHEVDNPDRIRSPLKRVGPNKFEKITWEQAYKEIGEKLLAVKSKHGPESVFWVQYPEGNAELTYRFMDALGSPNLFSHASTCFLPRNIGWWLTVGNEKPEQDFARSRFVLMVGRNPAAGLDLRQLRDLVVGRDGGGKLAVVDPRFSEAAAISSKWLRIRPGTDLALMLALAHVLIKEKLYQKEFVEKYTTGFAEFAAEVEKFTPEWAEDKTTIPKEDIVTTAREMAAAAPRAIVHRGYHGAAGVQYKNSLQLVRSIACVNGLLGNFNQAGGMYFAPKAKLGKLDETKHPKPPKVKAPMADGSEDPDRYPLTPRRHGLTHAIPELALSGKLKAGFVHHNNPLRTCPNPARVMEGYKKLELLVGFDYVLSETASICHYVLPESHYLERDDVVHTNHSIDRKQVSIRQQVLKPKYDTKPMAQILIELAQHVGIGQYFNFTLEEWNRAALAPLGITLEELKEKGVIDLGGEWTPGEPTFATPSGKLEFASSIMADFNLPAVPTWEEPLVWPDPKNPAEFRLIHGKQAHHTHARTANQPYLMHITTENDWGRAWINTKRAEALKIKDGDCMTLTSSVGKGRVRARVTDGIHPDCIFLPSGYGVFSKNLAFAKTKGQGGFGYGLSYNDFLPTYFEPVLGHSMANEIIVKVEKTFV
jgi:thiosulfate reductase/polysulfide reductase chain A